MAVFIDAHPNTRCDTRILLKDKSAAQCGRRQSQPGAKVCTQHRTMFRAGRQLIDFHTGEVMVSIIDRNKR